jgi:hypothetical protein
MRLAAAWKDPYFAMATRASICGMDSFLISGIYQLVREYLIGWACAPIARISA